MIRTVWTIAMAAWREGVRSQVFVNLLLFAGLAGFGGAVLDELTLGERGQTLMDVGLSSLSAIRFPLPYSSAFFAQSLIADADFLESISAITTSTV